MASNPKPSVGRTVHYVSYGSPVQPDGSQRFKSECRAAIITEIDTFDVCVSLCVFNPSGLFFNEHVHFDDGADDRGRDVAGQYDGGTWHWPERVGE